MRIHFTNINGHEAIIEGHEAAIRSIQEIFRRVGVTLNFEAETWDEGYYQNEQEDDRAEWKARR